MITTREPASAASARSRDASSPDWLGLSGQRVLAAGAGETGTACATVLAEAGAHVAAADGGRTLV